MSAPDHVVGSHSPTFTAPAVWISCN